MTVLETLWDIVVVAFYSILILYILYGICEFFDWIEYKLFEKDMNKELKRRRDELFWQKYDEDIRMQNIMSEWNW